MVRENAEEDMDDVEARRGLAASVGVVEICVFDNLATEQVAGRYVAFDDIHAELRTW